MKETKDDITPEAVLRKQISDIFLDPDMHEKIMEAMREYATIQAARAWDAAVSYESQRDNFLNFCKPITAPNKQQYLESLK